MKSFGDLKKKPFLRRLETVVARRIRGRIPNSKCPGPAGSPLNNILLMSNPVMIVVVVVETDFTATVKSYKQTNAELKSLAAVSMYAEDVAKKTNDVCREIADVLVHYDGVQLDLRQSDVSVDRSLVVHFFKVSRSAAPDTPSVPIACTIIVIVISVIIIVTLTKNDITMDYAALSRSTYNNGTRYVRITRHNARHYYIRTNNNYYHYRRPELAGINSFFFFFYTYANTPCC